jgi:periplasmic copper chaperone A
MIISVFKATQSFIAIVLLSIAFRAHAHVVFAEPKVAANTSFRGTLKVGHGCDGSPTVSVKVTIPDGFANIKPMPKAGWKIETKRVPLAKPIENHGKTITDTVGEISWSGGVLEDAHYDEFVFVGRTPEALGKQYFKVQQRCEKGEWNWVEVPTAGKARSDYKAPAAELEVTAAPAAANAGSSNLKHQHH